MTPSTANAAGMRPPGRGRLAGPFRRWPALRRRRRRELRPGMKQIVDRPEGYLAAAGHHDHGTGKPAVVFDIDDTLLNTYDYTLAEQFGYSPATSRDLG